MKSVFLLNVAAVLLGLVLSLSPLAAFAQSEASEQPLKDPDIISTTQLLDIVAESKGKVVMLNFFAAFCPPCREEIPGLIRIRKDLSKDDVLIIGIGLDESQEEMRDFVRELPFNYPVFYGGAEASYAFRIDAIPYNVIYDQSGRMVVNEPGYVAEAQLRTFLQSLLNSGE